MITGKEALIALANGEEVEYMDTSNTFKSLGWGNAFGLETNLFFSDRFKFRLKPRTITINEIEVPAPFEPKEGEVFYYINDYSENGYDWVNYCDNLFNNTVWIGKWRSEDEVKQVIAALRSVFNTK